MVIFISGQDNFRSNMKLQELKEKFIADVDKSRLNIATLDGTKLSIEKFCTSINASPFMAKRRMIIVNNVVSSRIKEKKFLTEILEVLETKKKANNIIIFYENVGFDVKDFNKKGNGLLKFLNEEQYTYNFPVLAGNNLFNWIKEIVTENKLEIQQNVINEFISLGVIDTWSLYNEINKLIAYVKGNNRTEITIEDIKKLVTSYSQSSIFEFVDCLGNKNRKKGLFILNELLENGSNELYILSMITRQFRLLLLVKEAQTKNIPMPVLAKQTGIHPFVLKKCNPQATNFSFEKLKKVYNSLLEMDRRMKTSKTNIKVLFDLLVFTV